MQEWILNNYNWLFSGIGVFTLGLIINFLFKKRRNHISQENSDGKMNNNVNARNVNINQTIVSGYPEKQINSEVDNNKETSKEVDEDVQRIKEKYADIGIKIRTELIKELEKTRNDKSTLKVFHMTDKMDEKYGINSELVISELEKLAEDGKIVLINWHDSTISPYTEIKVVTSKFFDSF